MLFWLGLIVLVVTIWIFNKATIRHRYGIVTLCGTITFLSSLFVLCSVIIFLCSILFYSKDKAIAKYNDIIKDIEISSEIEDIDSRNYNITRVSDRIISWNSSITFRRKYCKNFWIGIYLSDFYVDKDIKTIDYKLILEREE